MSTGRTTAGFWGNVASLSRSETPQNGYNLIVRYRCLKAPGSSFFFTVATFDRRKTLDL
jgi:hypothetical protein